MEQLPKGIMPSQYSDPCKPGLHITDKRLTSVKFLQFIRDAVYAYAHALHNQWQAECEGHPGVCEKMRNADGSVLKFYLEGASFTGINNMINLAILNVNISLKNQIKISACLNFTMEEMARRVTLFLIFKSTTTTATFGRRLEAFFVSLSFSRINNHLRLPLKKKGKIEFGRLSAYRFLEWNHECPPRSLWIPE